MNNHGEIVSFLWGTADLIRDSFKRGKYQDVILPFTVLRRIDSVLEPTKDDVVDAYEQYQDELDNLDPLLQQKSGYAFYNTSKFTFPELADSKPDELRENFETYIGAFSDNMEDVLRKFDFRNTLDKLERADLLHAVAQQFASVDLHPDTLSNEEMGLVFEELIRKSDLYPKTEEGKDAERIAFGSTLSDDAHRSTHFDYQLANPPYGKDWRRDKKAVRDEAKRSTHADGSRRARPASQTASCCSSNTWSTTSNPRQRGAGAPVSS